MTGETLSSHMTDPEAPRREADGSNRARGLPEWVAVGLLALAVGLAFQGTRHLWDPDEGRYTEVARRMLSSGDWLVPRLNEQQPHLTKPPLTYWAIAASCALFGTNEWAARLPNAVALALTALLVYGLARRLGLSRPARVASMWATMLGPPLSANAITTDTLLVLGETLAVYGFVASGFLEPRRVPAPWGLRVMWIGFGLAFLTKGPPGLLPLLAIVAWTAWQRPRDLGRLFRPLGLLLFAIVGLSWYAVLVWRSPDLLHYFLVRETALRFASSIHDRNSGPFDWLVYAPPLLIGSLPWLAIVPMRARSARRAGLAREPFPRPRRGFLALWICVPLIVLCLAQSRLPLYVLPLLVPMALWLGSALPVRDGDGRHFVMLVATAALLAVGIKGAAALAHPDRDAHRLAVELEQTVELDRVDEIVFVDMPARYGLRLYLGLEIEQVETAPGKVAPQGYVPPPLLCDELEAGERLLVIAYADRLDDLRQHLESCPEQLTAIATLRDWTVLGVKSRLTLRNRGQVSFDALTEPWSRYRCVSVKASNET